MTTATHILVPGTILNDQYQVVKPLGSGAMGSVLLATDLTLDRFVAIKVLHADVGQRFDHDQRFLREARLLSRLSHPNIVTLHAFARTGAELSGRHFIVMEYVAGETLEERLHRDRALAPRVYCHVMSQICSALAEAHRRGIVHRDLKPGNILVTTVGGDPEFVKVVDFGLAKRRDTNLSASGEIDELDPAAHGWIAGTPAYIAPEQAQGQPVDGRSDIYSLGVMACELLTGHHPFTATDPIALMVSHVSEPPRLPSQLRPDLGLQPGGPVDVAIGRALAKDPADRPPDATSFARELVGAIHAWRGGGTGVHELPTDEDTWDEGHPRPEAAIATRPAAARRTSSHETLVDLSGGALLSAGGVPSSARHAAVLHMDFEPAEIPSADATDEHVECLAVVAAKIRQAVLDEGGRLIGPLAERQVAVFGFGVEDELAIEQAVSAALAIRSALAGLSDDPTIPESFRLEFRLGVDAGSLAVGELRDVGLVIGGEPLFGARDVSRRAQIGEVRLSHRAFRVVRGLFECRPLKQRGAGTHWVVAGRKAVARHVGDVAVYGVPIELVGRQREVNTLLDAVALATGEQRVVPLLVHGPPGVGKTRLAWELARRLDEREEAYFFEAGRCTPGGHGVPYEPFVQAFRTRAHLEETDDAEATRLKLLQYVRRWVARDPTALDTDEQRLHAGLVELLHADAGDSPAAAAQTLEVHGEEARRAALFERVAALYRQIGQKHPLVFVIDDFQWASAPTRQLLAYLTSHLEGVPALFVVLQRDDGDDPTPEGLFPAHPDAARVRLAPLDERQTSRLIRHALRRLVEVPTPLVRQIRDLAQGIPLIVEETIHDLVEEGVIQVEGERWHLEAPTTGQLRLPGTVAQLLAGRVRRLPPSLRAPLEAAAVAGRRFWPEQLAELTHGAAGRDTLAELERRGFVMPLREVVVGGSHDWGFAQVAMRETVYGLVPKRRKQTLHRAVATWLGQHAGGGRGDDEIGHHYERAGDLPQALEHTLDAARRAKRVYAIEEAIRYLDACRRILDQLEAGGAATSREDVTAQVLEDLLHLRALSGDLQGAVQAADAALAHDVAVQGARRVRVAVRKGWVQMFLGQYREAAETIGAFEGAVEDPDLALEVATLAAGIRAKMGEAAEAAKAIRRAIQHQGGGATDAAQVARLSDAYRTLGNCEVWQGRHAQARDAYDTAYTLAVRANAPEAIVDALNGLAALHYFQGDPDGATRTWHQGLETAERWDLQQHRLILLNNLAEVTWSRGDLSGACELAARAEALAAFLGTNEAVADAHRIHAEALLGLRKPGEARPHAEAALRAAQAVGSPHFLGPAHRTLAKVLQAELRRGDRSGGASPKAVAQHLDAAIASFEGATMEAEVRATRDLRREFLGA